MKQGHNTLLLALLSSVPMLAWGLTPMDENQLADVSGRDGVTVTVSLPTGGVTWDQIIFDRDGVPADVNGEASVLGIPTSLVPDSESAIVMKGIGLTPTGPITLTADVGQSSGNAVLNISVAIPAGTVVHLPDLQLAVPTAPGAWTLDTAQTKTILSAGTTANPGIDVVLGATNMNLQLGNVAQTRVINGVPYNPLLLTDISIQQGVHIENLAITDASDPGSASYAGCNGDTEACAQTVADTYINDNNGTLAATKGTSDLTVKGLAMSVTSTGLAFAVDQVGYRDGSGVDHGINVQMENLHLGDAAVPGLGNAYLKGLQLGNDAILTISGH